jgi:hypothetical protein
MEQHLGFKDRIKHLHHKHERKMEVLFFCLGFGFDVFATGEGVDHTMMIVQQIIYLLVIGVILYSDVLREAHGGEAQFGPRMEKIWSYRSLALHFALGTLMNLYSIFFLLSASFFSSIVFVLVLFGALVLNELKVVRNRGADVKVALFVICLFCFFSLMFPLVFGHVGLLPFLCAFLTTLGVVGAFYLRLRGRAGPGHLKQKLLIPGLSVSGIFLALWLFGLIPPVPLSAKKMGVYHRIEKEGDDYVLYHERAWWKFWQNGDQDFVARPGDKVHFFAAISSPARINDSVFVHWMFHTQKGWSGSDRIELHITGGRKGGFRGFTTKQNFDYGDGRWKVAVETSDGREIGRMYFTVEKGVDDPGRVFLTDRY